MEKTSEVEGLETLDQLTVHSLPKALIEHHFHGLRPILNEWIELKRIPPVLLLTGTPGIGKREIAAILAQWVFCEKNPIHGFTTDLSQDLPCEKCPQCKRAQSGNWVDFVMIDSAEDEGSLKIDQFRELKESSGFGGFNSEYRAICIPDAERMTIQAANSILKILEEPPKGWIFFLTSRDRSLLLPTMQSRCQTIRLKPIGEEVLKGALPENELSENFLTLAGGSYKNALRLSDPKVLEGHELMLRFLAHPNQNFEDWLSWSTESDEHFQLSLEFLEKLLSDLIVPRSQSNLEEMKWWADLNKRFSRRFFFDQFELVQQTRKRANAPLNRKILFQELASPWFFTAVNKPK